MKASALPILRSSSTEPEAEKEYKPSLYNHFVEKEDVVWGINFRSTALVRLDRDDYQHVRDILDGRPVPVVSDHFEKLRRDLIKGRFLVPKNLDEIRLLQTKNRASRFGSHGLTLIIAPTLRCNFACKYCYVDRNAGKMSIEVRSRVGLFFEKRLPENTGATVVWTGGDPSLAMDVVEDLSRRFIAAAESKNCGYRSDLITNGYLLDEKMRRHLRNSRVTSLQISLDGSREFHDATRCLPNRKPTYDSILRNVEETCEEFGVYLRINVDARNAESIPVLLDDLRSRGLAGKVSVYFAQVDDVNENSAPYHHSCLSPEQFAKLEGSLVRLALGGGFSLGGRVLTRPVMTFCGANSQNYYVIDSSGNLLKCYHDLGRAEEHGIGRIDDMGGELVTNPYNLLKWLGWDSFELPECRNCKVLPLCMGGCSHKIMSNGMQVDNGCLKLRFSMDEIITIIGESRLRRSAASTCPGCAETGI